MMGRSHAMSAAAIALTAAAIGTPFIDARYTAASVLILSTTVFIGGALQPDIDSHGSTVVRSFGIFGWAAYEFANFLSLLVYGATKTKRDEDKSNGHRTFFHTIVFAVLVGFLVSLVSSIPGSVSIYGHSYMWGQLGSLFVMWIFLHLGIAGIFEKQIKKARKQYGPYLMMLGTLAATVMVSRFLPENQTYWWLGFAAGGGMLVHILGDFPTKMGVPALWPLKISGKRWYNVGMPSFLRFSAGGDFENNILFPIFAVTTVISGICCIPAANSFARTLLGQWFGLA
jgi:membrane-bound metal-dependent hydrolase YbcI (DUF457 family)